VKEEKGKIKKEVEEIKLYFIPYDSSLKHQIENQTSK